MISLETEWHCGLSTYIVEKHEKLEYPLSKAIIVHIAQCNLHHVAMQMGIDKCCTRWHHISDLVESRSDIVVLGHALLDKHEKLEHPLSKVAVLYIFHMVPPSHWMYMDVWTCVVLDSILLVWCKQIQNLVLHVGHDDAPCDYRHVTRPS